VAAEWLHEGLYNKVLGGDPRHEEIVASIPGLSRAQAVAGMRGLGLAETGIAAVVLSGRKRKEIALLQTGLVVVMNAGGLLFASKHIPNHRRLVMRSSIFITLVWVAAQDAPNE
jgi:DoxX-like family